MADARPADTEMGMAMDDLKYGTRNKRGDWTPDEPLVHAPLFAFPPRPLALLKWLPHYFLPWNLLWLASAVAWWVWIVPAKVSVKVMKTTPPVISQNETMFNTWL